MRKDKVETVRLRCREVCGREKKVRSGYYEKQGYRKKSGVFTRIQKSLGSKLKIIIKSTE